MAWLESLHRRSPMSRPLILLSFGTIATGAALLGLVSSGVGSHGLAQSGYVPTYYVDVQPILQKNCVSCHVAGGIAPFALDNPSDAVKRADQIAAVTKSGYMPPWPPSKDSQAFLNERRLGAASKQILEDWANAKAPLGKAPKK
jgi:mono/diheme cytochrome c family protein